MVITSRGTTWEGLVLHMGGMGNAHTMQVFWVGRKRKRLLGRHCLYRILL